MAGKPLTETDAVDRHVHLRKAAAISPGENRKRGKEDLLLLCAAVEAMRRIAWGSAVADCIRIEGSSVHCEERLNCFTALSESIKPLQCMFL